MRAFARLYAQLDATTSTRARVDAMATFFADADPEDAVWAVWFLSGERPRRLLVGRALREAAAQVTGHPTWMFEACYHEVGDLAETVALLVEPVAAPDPSLHATMHTWMTERILPLRDLDEAARVEAVTAWWIGLPHRERFLFTKLITGSFRVGVGRTLTVRALAQASGLERAVLEHRLMGDWTPTPEAFVSLLAEEEEGEDASRPYPYCLAHPLQDAPATLGDRADWLVEWKWDGIRAQLLRRQGQTFLWSRGEELITERFPELHPAAEALPDGTVLDGEILGWDRAHDRPLPFGDLQIRIQRKTVAKKHLKTVPAWFMAYDLLEEGGEDIRSEPTATRRARLETLLADPPDRIRLSPEVTEPTWEGLAALRESSRARRVEGFMLKHRDSPYRSGRRKGAWWKWKVDPFTADMVLTYAQPGSGRRASQLTDHTFGVWDGEGSLVTVAKAYSGLSKDEIAELDAWIRRHTTDRFGPVRAVEPELVFELPFDDLRPSGRHKSGLALRFPRIHRWRRDKRPEDADTLASLTALLDVARPPAPPSESDP